MNAWIQHVYFTEAMYRSRDFQSERRRCIIRYSTKCLKRIGTKIVGSLTSSYSILSEKHVQIAFKLWRMIGKMIDRLRLHFHLSKSSLFNYSCYKIVIAKRTRLSRHEWLYKVYIILILTLKKQLFKIVPFQLVFAEHRLRPTRRRTIVGITLGKLGRTCPVARRRRRGFGIADIEERWWP